MPLPYDYQYWLASMLLDRLNTADGELADFLHSHTGYKYYTFSWLLSDDLKTTDSGLQFDKGYFYLTSPDKKFIQGFASGLLQEPKFNLGHTEFIVESIEILDGKEIRSEVTFKTLSPIYTKTKREKKGEWDLLPLKDMKWHENIHNNLLNRYIEYYGEEPERDDFEITKFYGQPEYKRVSIKKRENSEEKEYYKRCARIKFDVEGNPEMLKFGYDAGFGQGNAMGFGCVGVVDDA